MRRLLAWNLMSLDGYFEGPAPWDLAFHQRVWGDELEALSISQLEEIGTLLFGRKTYQGMADYWAEETGTIAEMMNGTDKAVISSTLRSADWPNTTLLGGDAVPAVKALKEQEGKDVYVFGSAELLSALLDAGLVDEYRLCLAPVVLGAGTALFKAGREPQNMDLIDTRTLKSGGVVLRYRLGGGIA